MVFPNSYVAFYHHHCPALKVLTDRKLPKSRHFSGNKTEKHAFTSCESCFKKRALPLGFIFTKTKNCLLPTNV